MPNLCFKNDSDCSRGMDCRGPDWKQKDKLGDNKRVKQHPVGDVTGDGSKVRCCKEQYCTGTWGDSPDKNTGVGSHVLLQGTLPHPGIKAVALKSPPLAAGFSTTSTAGEAPDTTAPCVCLPSGPVPHRFCSCDLPTCLKEISLIISTREVRLYPSG